MNKKFCETANCSNTKIPSAKSDFKLDSSQQPDSHIFLPEPVPPSVSFHRPSQEDKSNCTSNSVSLMFSEGQPDSMEPPIKSKHHENVQPSQLTTALLFFFFPRRINLQRETTMRSVSCDTMCVQQRALLGRQQVNQRCLHHHFQFKPPPATHRSAGGYNPTSNSLLPAPLCWVCTDPHFHSPHPTGIHKDPARQSGTMRLGGF